VLISDTGFDGLIIKIKSQPEGIKVVDSNFIESWTGNSLASVVTFAKDNGLNGLEWAIGIPGTFGGAIRGNAGAFGSSINDAVQKVRVLDLEGDEFKTKDLTKEECGFKYRNSLFKKDSKFIIVSAVLKLNKVDKEQVQKKMNEIMEKRNEKHPQGIASAGSFFVNPKITDPDLIGEFEKDSGKKSLDNIIPAGWLIQEAGLSGKRIGGAMISEKHANFIVNTGNATAEDIIMLASIIKQKVRTKFKVQLVEEVKFLGF
jgi:UDP-N-acetylmuramate dehydrogenase